MTDREIFKDKFNLPRDGFLKPVDLIDVEIGFCVYKKQESLKREGFESIFKIYIKNRDLGEEGDKKPVTITIAYGKRTKDGLISYSSDPKEFKRDINWPVELISTEDFFYNIQTHDFYYKDKTISGDNILDIVNKWHLKPTKLGEGFKLRVKMRFYYIIVPGFFKILFNIVSGIQYLLSGIKINFHDLSPNTVSPDPKPGKKIKIFDYKVELWIAVIYSLIHLLIFGFFFYFNYRPKFLVAIFKNIFLTIMYVIPSLGFIDCVLSKIPKNYITKWLLTFIREQYLKAAYKRIKI